MADREGRGRRAGRVPRRSSFLSKLIVSFLVLSAGGGGYLAWRYHQRTGEIDLDRDRWNSVVSDEVDGAKAGLEKAKRVIGDASRRTVRDARELLASVEVWLEERKVAPASRRELEDAGREYARRLTYEKGQEPAAGSEPPGDARADAPAGGEAVPETAGRAAAGEAAEFLGKGREEFHVGLGHWRAAGEPGSAREQDELVLAREHFTSAQDHLTRAQKGAPDDPRIEKLLVDTNRFLYDCLKRLKVDVRG